MLTFSWLPGIDTRDQAIDRFRNAGAPPAGVVLLGRWTRADLGGGHVLLEAQDPGTLTEFAYRWSDLMKLEVTPVMEDDDLRALFERVAT
ncbi:MULTISPECIES: DUF3303 domain-containing protein [Paraburkholderia]|uniref:DUF3303 domain-containing protein n=2 Tax=Burkholderiaceae TaxID=119060 RepID=A0ABR7Q268_9BURK|nr:DUF3303 family protein [Paraburkholderia podalyriae]MBC8752637.1 DUF3303 domain-containing protein [Paraburkholderia podalyriae]